MDYISNNRSVLFNIEPCGRGTGLVESMTSYIIRLSEKHSIHVGDLVNQLIIPSLEKDYLYRSAIFGGNSFFEGAKTINGYTSNAKNVKRVLSNLTGREDLTSLSLIGLENLFANRGLLKNNLSWCPNCIGNSFTENNEVYYPLIWFVKEVEICGKHQCLLIDRCPYCHKTNQILRRRMNIGYCSHCSKKLYSSAISNETISEEKKDWYNFVYRNISSIIKGNNCFFYMDKKKKQLVIQQLNILNIKCFNNDINIFSKFVGIPKNTLRAWLNGENSPRLEGLLLVCFKLNITLSNLFLDLQDLNMDHVLPRNFNTKNPTLARSYAPLDLKQIQMQLNNILNFDIPISMFQAAKKIGRDKRVLYSNFPDLCKDISKRYKKYEESQRFQRNLKIKLQIKYVVTELLNTGIKPTRVEVERRLNRNSLLRNPELNAYWKELIEIIDTID